MFSADPELIAKIADAIGSTSTRRRTASSRVWTKARYGHRDRTQPQLPMQPPA